MKFCDISELGSYTIIKTNMKNYNKLSGFGLSNNKEIVVTRINSHLITFKTSLTELFARRNDLDIEVEKNDMVLLV